MSKELGRIMAKQPSMPSNLLVVEQGQRRKLKKSTIQNGGVENVKLDIKENNKEKDSTPDQGGSPGHTKSVVSIKTIPFNSSPLRKPIRETIIPLPMTHKIDDPLDFTPKRTIEDLIQVGENENIQFLRPPKSVVSFSEAVLLKDAEGNTPIASPNKRSLKKSRTLLVYDYFADEETERLHRHDLMKDDYFFKESEVNFNLQQYVEFFFYHLVYFLITGPFIAMFLIVKPSLRTLFYNMEFLRMNFMAIVQALYWMISMYILVGYIIRTSLHESSNQVFDETLLKVVITSIILRTTSIAGKYATYPRQLIKKYKEVRLERKVITAEFMLIGWLVHGPQIRETELFNCVERLEIDSSAFIVSFLAQVSRGCVESMEKIIVDRKLEGADVPKICFNYRMNDKSFIYYNAELLTDMMIKEYNRNNISIKRQTIIGIIIGMAWAFAPSFMRLYLGQSFHGNDAHEILATYLNGLLSSFLFYVQFMFYYQAIVDMARKVYLLSQLGYMLSPKMLKFYSHPKLLPTINILDTVSLHTWYNMRRMSLDYGRKYFYRHEIFLPVNLLLLLLNIVGYFATLYLNKGKDTLNHNTWKLLLSFIIDALFIFVASFHFMFRAGTLNVQFDLHIGILLKNKLLLEDILSLRHYYFSSYLGSTNEFGRNYSEVIARPVSCELRRMIIQEVEKVLGSKLDESKKPDEVLQAFFNEIITYYEKLIQDLEHAKVFEQVKILGFEISKSSVVNFFVGLASIIFTIYQLIFGGG